MKAIEWRDEALWLLDQLRLPKESRWEAYHSADEVVNAIALMKVRGAPAIAAAAAYGVALEAFRLTGQSGETPWRDDQQVALTRAIERLGNARPTAVNLRWAMERMSAKLSTLPPCAGAAVATQLLQEAHAIMSEDESANYAMGRHGLSLFGTNVRILTHCNTGALATAAYGTALGVIRALAESGQLKLVYVDETRPYLQGARLTAYELAEEGIPHTLITDSMAGYFLQQKQVDAVIVGADRIAANGDTANKIGTYSLAVLCHYHKVPFYVAAPLSTFDLNTVSGREIPIEERSADEVTHVLGVRIAPEETTAAHPAFDVTPHELITAIITERGVISSPNEQVIAGFLSGAPKR